MKKIPLKLRFYLDPELRKARNTMKQKLFGYLSIRPISLEEASRLPELVYNSEWMSQARYLSESLARELDLCRYQYHARMSEIRRDLTHIHAPFFIVSVLNPYDDGVLHFLVDTMRKKTTRRLKLAV